jgi:hypothetical protein
MTARGARAAASAGPVCWVDADWDRSRASDGISRYGAYLRGHTEAFQPLDGPDASGITLDPGEFAAAALRVATGPIMSPGYVRWHPRVLDHTVGHGQDPEPGRLVCQVTLATSLPLRLGAAWWSWTQHLGRDWCEPGDDRHAALARLELRWPLATGALPRPSEPAVAGQPNLRDATAAVAALVAQVNATAGPVLAELERGAVI